MMLNPFLSSNKLTKSLNNYNTIHFNSPLPLRHFATNNGENNDGNGNLTTIDSLLTEISLNVKKEQNLLLEKDETLPKNNIVKYNDICNITNLELGLKRTKSGVSAGLDGEIKANYTTSKLEKLAEELKSHTFKASPIKKV